MGASASAMQGAEWEALKADGAATIVKGVVDSAVWRASRRHRLVQRLQRMGARASIEISPRDTEGKEGGGDGELVKLLASDDATTKLVAGVECFVNYVHKSEGHLEVVLAACRSMQAHGLVPVPHLPACRFGKSDEAFAAALDKLKGASITHAMVLGGNDQQDRADAGEVSPTFASAAALLTDKRQELLGAGVRTVSVGGYPEGHPGLGFDAAKTAALLEGKVRCLLEDGFDVIVATQFCFDAGQLLRWVAHTRHVPAESPRRWPAPPRTARARAGLPGASGSTSASPDRPRRSGWLGSARSARCPLCSWPRRLTSSTPTTTSTSTRKSSKRPPPSWAWPKTRSASSSPSSTRTRTARSSGSSWPR
mmetsp:Transcript_9538/g.24241  ORF Transcript_9538/g.24241 Transcript_9538/m.24241 type:complete len:366 (+) Transcript_9538:1889-2986(+)